MKNTPVTVRYIIYNSVLVLASRQVVEEDRMTYSQNESDSGYR